MHTLRQKSIATESQETSLTFGVKIIHHLVPGRMRIRVRHIYRNQRTSDLIEKFLQLQEGIRRVRTNPLTSSILIRYESNTDPFEMISRLEMFLDEIEYYVKNNDHHQKKNDFDWHHYSTQETISLLNSNKDKGLNESQVFDRHLRFGSNVLDGNNQISMKQILFRQFFNLPVGVLTGAAAISLSTGGIADGGLILSVVAINGMIGFVTEHGSEKTIRSMTQTPAYKVSAIRNGIPVKISSENLVVGDIINLQEELIPADARLIKSHHLRIDESALTGESQPIKKNAQQLHTKNIPLADRSNMIYRGTVMTQGRCQGIVVGVGNNTEIGLINHLVNQTIAPPTKLQEELNKLGNRTIYLAASICGGVFALGILRGLPWGELLKSSISLAIAAIPEGLTAVGTTCMAFNIRDLEKDRILARSLTGLEALGACDVLCLDKTGTITQNQMEVVAGYLGTSSFTCDNNHMYQEYQKIVISSSDELNLLCKISSLCNDADIKTSTSGSHQYLGSSTEAALLKMCKRAKADFANIRTQFPRLTTQYRDDDRQFMITEHQDDTKQFFAVKGNPTQVLTLCTYHLNSGKAMKLTDLDRQVYSKQNKILSKKGLRVLGFAYGENQNEFTWLGIVGLQDPPRNGIKNLISTLKTAGIATIILTGDQMQTARAIGKEIGLGIDGNIEIAPDNWPTMPKEQLTACVDRYHIFPRVSPSAKLDIVQALQNKGLVVGMTGDGINDAPALKAADIGIAMGKTGTTTAQEAADFILIGDNFQSLITAISKGRTMRVNIRLALHYLLATNLSEILVMLGGVGLGLGMPLNPMQLLWINLVTDIFPSLAISLGPQSEDILEKQPSEINRPLLSVEDEKNLLSQGLVITAATLGIFLYGLRKYPGPSKASSMAFLTITSAQLWHAFVGENGKQAHKGAANPHLKKSVVVGFTTLFLAIYFPPLRILLGGASLGLKESLIAGAAGLLPSLLLKNKKDKSL